MFTSEAEHFMATIKSFARFLYTRICPFVHNLLRWIRPSRFSRTCTVCEVPSGTPPFLPNCFSPRTLLSDSPFLPLYYTNTTYLFLQKSFQCGIVYQSTGCIKSNNQFPLKFLISLVDLLLFFIINYINYKNASLSKRNYYVFTEFE